MCRVGTVDHDLALNVERLECGNETILSDTGTPPIQLQH